jgi:hypothetical protein
MGVMDIYYSSHDARVKSLAVESGVPFEVAYAVIAYRDGGDWSPEGEAELMCSSPAGLGAVLNRLGMADLCPLLVHPV